MGRIKSFEDMEVWQRSRAFAHRIYELTLEGSFAKDYALKDQINKSSVAIMDTIAEGFERGGNREFVQFLSYSKGSVGESRAQLYGALDRKHISQDVFNELKDEALTIGKMLGGFMKYLQQSEFKGSKFHEPDTFYETNLQSQTFSPDRSDLES
jgi:four helix bundle protein